MVTKLSSRATPRPAQPTGKALLQTPFVLLVAGLLFVGVMVWALALRGEDSETTNVACPISPQAEDAGISKLSSHALDRVDPLPLGETRVRVLNANGETGQAGVIAARLAEVGFQSAPEASGNDPLYPSQNLDCHGQIRFGDMGEQTARSLSIAAPCMELVRDGREDAIVDLALGATFAQLTDSSSGVAVLDQLRTGSAVDPDQITQARSAAC